MPQAIEKKWAVGCAAPEVTVVSAAQPENSVSSEEGQGATVSQTARTPPELCKASASEFAGARMGAHEPATLTDQPSMDASSSSEFVGAQSLATPPTDCMAPECASATAEDALGMFEYFILLASIAAAMCALVCTTQLDAAGWSRPGLTIPKNLEEVELSHPGLLIPMLVISLLLLNARAVISAGVNCVTLIRCRILGTASRMTSRKLYYLHAQLKMRTARGHVSCLIDSGATDCFISHRIVKELDITPCPLAQPIELKLADGKVNFITAVLPRVTLQIAQQQLTVTLYVTDIADDVILGMPFLTEYNPAVDWQSRTVTLTDSKGRKITHFASERSATQSNISNLLISKKGARKMIKRNCPTFVVRLNSVSSAAAPDEPRTGGADNANCADWCRSVISEFNDVFDDPKGVPPERPDCPVVHEIPVIPGSVPPARAAYKLSPSELEELKRHVDGLLEKGFITPSSSSYAAPILFVRKKDGTWRMVIDYRALNSITVPNKYPLPNIDQLFEQLSGAKYFSKIDLTSGYHQIGVSPDDRHKTAFITRYGLYEFTVLPFGLTAAPSTFQRAMNTLLREFLDKGIIVYLDDILIYTKTQEEHTELLIKLFTKLRANKFYAKLSKCSFGQGETEFLGHIVSAEGIRPLHDKLAAIKDWPQPKSITEVQSFLGLANYYRRFVENFAGISAPLTELTKKTSSIEKWDASCDDAFNALKTALTTAPVLRLPDLSKPVFINTDASSFAISAVFQQLHNDELHPVLFWSRKLASAERNYDTREREMLAIITIAKLFRHYLDDARFFTDHDTLKRFQTQKQLTGRLARWMHIIQDLKLDIKHIKGSENRVADALSRRADYKNIENADAVVKALNNEFPEGRELNKINNISQGKIESSSLSGDFAARIKTHKWTTTDAQQAARTDNVFLQDGFFKVRSRSTQPIIVPPDTQLRMDIIEQAHIDSGHSGYRKTIARLHGKVFWSGMTVDVGRYVQHCHVCQTAKHSTQQKTGLLHPMPVPSAKFDIIGIDFVVDLPVQPGGLNCLIVVVDHLTKFTWAFPCSTTITAAQCAELLHEKLFSIYGLPAVIVSDRDSRFTSAFWESLMTRLRVKLHRSTAHHPETDGAVERMNQMIEQLIRCNSDSVGSDWLQKLPGVLLSLNTNVSASTGYSPAQLMFGYQPRNILELEFPAASEQPAADDLLRKMRADMQEAQRRLTAAKEAQKKFADRHRRDAPEFATGDLVLLSSKHLRLSGPRKFWPRWVGPFPVIKKIGQLSYKLQMPDVYARLHPVFHTSLLKPYFTADQTVTHVLPALADEDPEVYEVQAILNHKFVGHPRRLVFHIFWKGYPIEEATWEPPESLSGCAELLQAYITLHKLQKYVYW
jgi:transposase InsO family protein